ncbi:ParA family protein [uncultured Muribaculum sp.]|uniref:ParA family protein n=1 Tax=uncultured Muribaculum sp. TaxID=1918613 RepID=UPI0026F3E60B|nr:AAA family ATPase [uncultured Muribaculum sp.]
MIIALANQKGGVAKTTSVFNIGVELASRGNKVLMVDFDAQASLTICAGLEPYDYEKNIVSVIRDGLSVNECTVQIKDNLYILTSDIELAAQEMALVVRTMRELVLQKALNAVKKEYDYILIDCPPQLSILTINALSASDVLIIPCKTDYLSYRGLEQLQDTIDVVKNEVNKKLKVLGIIATLYEQKVKDDQDVLEFLEKKGNVITTVKKLAIAKKGVYSGMAVVEQDSKNDISLSYKKICDVIEKERASNGN